MNGGRALLFLLFAASAVRAEERMPAWARGAAAPPAQEADVPAVVLRREVEIAVAKNGQTSRTERTLLRCLTASCGDHAVAAVPYLRGTQTVSNLALWIQDASGAVRVLGRKEAVDAALDVEDLYDESRGLFLSARREVAVGSLVAMEWTRRDSYAFPQEVVALQDRLPVVAARCTLTLPPGWRADAATLNHAPLEGRAEGTRTTWEAGPLPYLPDEPLAPTLAALAPRLVLSIHPAPGEGGALPSFSSWADVGGWAATLFEPAAAADETVAAKMRLLAPAGSPRERLRAAARFVQDLTYVSVQMDLGRGGGYRPRAAAEGLRRGYGDCKDKVTLLRALLRAAGMETRAVLVCSRDATSVRRDLPSPFFFDHVIAGIAGVEPLPGDAAVELPGVGRLLLFDPTDPVVPVGQLPEALWGGLGLVVSPERSALATIPSGRAVLERSVEATLTADGSFQARLKETGSGATGESLRALARRANRDELLRALETWLGRNLPGVRVAEIAQGEGRAGPTLELALFGRMPGAQAAGRLLVIRPVLVPWRGLPPLSSSARRTPVVLAPRAFSAAYRIHLPATFAVSELPQPVRVERPWGKYTMTVGESDGTIVVEQDLRLDGATVPAAEYESARGFVQAVLGSREAAVVLERIR